MTNAERESAVGYETMDQAVGRRIHQLMWDRRITNVKMAPALGIDASGLGRRLRGERGWSTDELFAAGRFLNVSLLEIFPGDTVSGPTTPGGVGPAGIEPTTSTVEVRRLAPVTELRPRPSHATRAHRAA